MAFVLLGSDFQQSPLEELESLERHADEIRDGLTESQGFFYGAVVISTCNRFEVYLDTDDFHAAVEQVVKTVAEVSGLSPDHCSKLLRVSYGDSVAQHLYSVASGLESMIIGEGEIAGQVKRSLQEAQIRKQVSSSLQRLFQSAAAVSKRVSAQTGLGAAGRSIINAGLDLYEANHGALDGKSVLLMGTGAYARVIVAALKRANCAQIYSYSATGRAELFSEGHGTVALSANSLTSGELAGTMATIDLAVTASGGATPSINFHLAQKVAQLREDPLTIIDVTLSGGVSKSVLELPDFKVYTLEAIREFAPAEHAESVLTAQEIVRESVASFEAEETARQVDPMVAALRSHVTAWVKEEIERVRRKSGDAAADEVGHSLNRVVNALLHTPSVNAKSLAQDGNHSDYLAAIKTLFNIDLQAELPTGEAHG